MKRKLQASILLAVLITATSIVAQPGAVAAGASICNSASCDNPQQSTVLGEIRIARWIGALPHHLGQFVVL